MPWKRFLRTELTFLIPAHIVMLDAPSASDLSQAPSNRSTGDFHHVGSPQLSPWIPDRVTAANLPESFALRTSVLRVRYEVLERVAFPPAAANVWRGLIGAFLHRLSPGAEDPERTWQTLYGRLFSSPSAGANLPSHLSPRLLGTLGLTGSHLPHPFVLRSRLPDDRRDLKRGDGVVVEIVLIEQAIGFLPALCAAFESFGDAGVGRRVEQAAGRVRRGRMRLSEADLDLMGVCVPLHREGRWHLPTACDISLFSRAESLAPRTSPLPAAAASLTVRLQSPLRLRVQGKPVGRTALNARLLADALFRRLGGLSVCYGPRPPGEQDLEAFRSELLALASRTTLEPASLRDVERYRYSSSQRARLPAGGLVGRFGLHASGPDLATWHALLTAVEPLHLGKGSSFGQGWLVPLLAPYSTAAHS